MNPIVALCALVFVFVLITTVMDHYVDFDE